MKIEKIVQVEKRKGATVNHKYKITDATKDELIQYFFGVEGFGGGHRVPADKDRFLM